MAGSGTSSLQTEAEAENESRLETDLRKIKAFNSVGPIDDGKFSRCQDLLIFPSPMSAGYSPYLKRVKHIYEPYQNFFLNIFFI